MRGGAIETLLDGCPSQCAAIHLFPACPDSRSSIVTLFCTDSALLRAAVDAFLADPETKGATVNGCLKSSDLKCAVIEPFLGFPFPPLTKSDVPFVGQSLPGANACGEAGTDFSFCTFLAHTRVVPRNMVWSSHFRSS